MGNPFEKRFWSRLMIAAAAVMSACVFVTADAQAQRSRDDDEEEDNANRVFSADVGEIVVVAQEKLTVEPPDFRGAIAELDRALNVRGGVSPYELGVIMYMRGGAKYQLDDISGALADWNRALNEGDLAQTERLNIMYNVGQLYLSEGNYREAVNRIEEWIRLGGDANPGVHLNLVAAYVELGEWSNALRHGREGFNKAPEPKEKRYFDTLNYLYTEMDMPAERADLLSQMVVLFPREKNVWLSIAALHAQAGREQKAFEINKIMYLNGMLTSESEIMRVVDYYSYYQVPFRGARILEREMNAGRVDRDQENYEKLARLYRQANEFDRAIPALEAAARMSPDGELYRTLGEAYYAEARLEEAERSLVQAINRGGIEKTGDVWIIVGNARYEAEDREGAIDAFTQAERYPSSREDARSWREFVEQEIAAARNRRQFEVDVAKDQIRVSCERQLQDIILYEERASAPDYDGPDCIAIVRRQDFASVPEIVEMQQAIYDEFDREDDAEGETDEASLTAPDEEAAAEDPAGDGEPEAETEEEAAPTP